MDEFIEGFEKFRNYLYNYEGNLSTEGESVLEDLIAKFEELGLDDVF